MGEKRFGRRDAILGAVSASAAASAMVSVETHAQEERRPEPVAAEPDRSAAHGLERAENDVRALFGDDLRESALVEGRWRIESIYGLRAGAIPIVMSSGALRFAIEIFRSAPDDPSPIARAGALALFLVNRGDGRTETPQIAGLGVLALGRALETRLAAGAPVPRALTTHAERQRMHPTGVFHVPV